MPTVELTQAQRRPDPFVDASRIDRPPIRIGPRTIEALYAADKAKQVFGGTSIKRVRRKTILALHQAEAAFRRNDVDEAGHRADRAVARPRVDLIRQSDLETHGAAVASARAPGDRLFRHR